MVDALIAIAGVSPEMFRVQVGIVASALTQKTVELGGKRRRH